MLGNIKKHVHGTCADTAIWEFSVKI